ncbi:MAG TPA: mercury(II) reductase [Solirubrobacteraceae bacterium]|nr:mercury(II) reductase [Solirubrobacteraceae bacterium]
MSVELEITGMTCEDCARHVAAALGRAGATDVCVDWRAGRAIVEPGGASNSALTSALDGTQYSVQQIGEPTPAIDGAGGHFEYDLAIIGSGGGAFAAAIAARDRQLRVIMVERGVVGGTCVNVGCIPSKALLAAAESRSRALQERFPGISTDAGAVDMGALITAKDEIVGALRRDKYISLADEYGFDLLEGHARFVAGPALDVDGRRVEASHYLVATGADPDVPDIPGLASSDYLTSTTAMELDSLSSSMVVIGGGYVAMEQAQLFAHLGTKVTMLVRSTLARGAEPEVSDAIREAFEAEGIAVHEGVVPERVERDGAEVVALVDGREFRAEHLLVATGRAPRTSGLGLEDVGVQLGDGGAVVVDADMSTANPRIWGAGDVTGHPQFVYVAAKHGGLVVDNAFDAAGRRIDYSGLPRITFTNPTIASAGLTEAQALERGIDCTSRTLSLEHVPRAIVSRNTRGLVKLVAERDSMGIIGVHIVGDGAGDVILAGSLAIQTGMTVGQLAGGWNPYLTLGEGLYLAAQSFTRDTSKLSCCAA